MAGSSHNREWSRIIAAVAVRLHVSPNEVRDMQWTDFREVLRLMGAKVPQTPQEIQAEIKRMIDG